jgi:hypothetical protein
MKPLPYIINQDASGESLSPIDINSSHFNEFWLQELLRLHPNILPLAEIEPIYYPAVPIGREVTTEVGAIDNLFISHRGYPVLVETKLWRNPEAKREVFAQVLDYGTSISKWSYQRIDQIARTYVKKYEHQDCNLVSWVESRCGPVEGGPEYFEEVVTRNLRLGRFLTLMVGDRIRQSVVEMLDHIKNKFPHLALDVALVELACYRSNPHGNWPLFVAPSIVAKTQIVERSIVQVTVQQNGSYQLEVKQEKAEAERAKRRVMLTEEAYWELLKMKSPANFPVVRELVEKFRAKEGISIDPGTASLVVRLGVQDSGEQISLFFIDKRGILTVYPGSIRDQLDRIRFDSDLVYDYRLKVRDLLQSGEKRFPNLSISKVDLRAFEAVVDAFIEKVQSAERREH